jgi:hypothetical protein
MGFLYQYFKYPVDSRRRNEYGQAQKEAERDDGSDDEDEIDAKLLEEKEKEASQSAEKDAAKTIASEKDTAEAEGLRKRK